MTSRMLKTTVLAAVIATAFAGGYSINHEQSLVAGHAAAQAPTSSPPARAPAPWRTCASMKSMKVDAARV